MVKFMKKILIIDDQKAIRNTLKEILEYEKHAVYVAEDGKIGLQMTIENNYDLIFCDIKMPNLDGIEFLKKVMEEKIISPSRHKILIEID